jgi:cytidylate kinase
MSAPSIPKQGPVVAIDGPAGTGKSSATRRLADVLGFVHIDTGALYRAIAYLTMEQLQLSDVAVPSDDGPTQDFASEDFCKRAIDNASSVKLEFKRDGRRNPANRVLANGKDLTALIRTPVVSMASSKVSAVPEVRAALHELQRRLGAVGKTILEGRDIGTVIFPDADVKFFLTASIEERAKRRLIELEAAGSDAPSFEEVKAQIADRDQGDMTRAVAPLRKALDAIEIDTSDLTLDQVVQRMESLVRARLKGRG